MSRVAAAVQGGRAVEAERSGSGGAIVADRAAAVGASARKPIEVRVSYAGECGVEEAVSRYLAARENARALGAVQQGGL